MKAEFILDGRIKIGDDLIVFAKIRFAIADPAVSEIVLIFVNTCCFIEDSVLALRSLLLERRLGVVLRTQIYSDITNPDILLYLLGDVREVKNKYARVFIKDQKIDNLRTTGAVANRRVVAKLIESYLPVETLSKQWLTKKDLSDWGLIEDSPVQNYLKEIQGELQEF